MIVNEFDSEPEVELEIDQPVDGVRDTDVGNDEICTYPCPASCNGPLLTDLNLSTKQR